MAEDWGIKVSLKNQEVSDPVTSANAKKFVVVSTIDCFKIEKAEYVWNDDYDRDEYVITILGDQDVPLTFTFIPDDKTNPTIWDII